MKQTPLLAHHAFALLLLAGCGSDSVAPPTPISQPMYGVVVSGSQVAAPSNVSAVLASDIAIDIGWQDNTTNETRFEVQRSTSGPAGPFSLLLNKSANVTTHRDGGLAAASQYCYRIRAVRVTSYSTVVSPYSGSACAQTPPAALPVPQAASGVAAAPGSSIAVYVRWTASGLAVDGFRIGRSTDGGSVWNLAATVSRSDRVFLDRGLESEQQVCYRVTAFNASGDAPPSNTACTTPPAAPTGLTATQVDAETFELSWADNSAVEQGYAVWAHSYYAPCCPEDEGSACDAGTYEGDDLIGELPANATTFRQPGVVGQDICGYFAWYEVFATRDGGYSTGAMYLLDP
jgi:hypothetical protein